MRKRRPKWRRLNTPVAVASGSVAYGGANPENKKMEDEQQKLFVIKYPFGDLIVDEDIYYRIIKDKTKRPDCKFKAIKAVNTLNKIVNCRLESDKKWTLARLLMKPKRNELVDHIERNPLDNRRSKLRVVTPRQNSLNRTPNSSTGFIGVSLTNNRGKMRLRSTFQAEYKRFHFRMNDDNPENRIICAIVHDKFVIESGDEEYAPLNFPILKEEPLRSELIKTNIAEFHKPAIQSFINRITNRGIFQIPA